MRQVPVKQMKLHDFKAKKDLKNKISMLTCYDYPSARIVAESDIDVVLVGDSVAMVVHGHSSTIHASMEMMLLHTAAVSRGLSKQFLVSDLPFLSYRTSLADTVQNAKGLIQAGAHALKLEGADNNLYETIQHLVASGIPIMGHIGLTPQSVLQLGGYKVQGKMPQQAQNILEQARQLEESGCFAIVLECVPESLAESITAELSIPTIGIGAGVKTDGQVLVWHDMLGLQTDFMPRFVQQFAQGKETLLSGINNYVEQVQNSQFPSIAHTYIS